MLNGRSADTVRASLPDQLLTTHLSELDCRLTSYLWLLGP
jgi:hypothetical protein